MAPSDRLRLARSGFDWLAFPRVSHEPLRQRLAPRRLTGCITRPKCLVLQWGQLGTVGNWENLQWVSWAPWETGHPWLEKLCAAGYYSCRDFFSAKMTTLGFDKPFAAGFPAGAVFWRKLTSSNFTMLMLADFGGVLMIFDSFHDTFPQCPPDLSW